MDWDQETDQKFKKLLEKIPIFLRDIAKEKVAKKAENLAETEHQSQVTEKNLVDALFEETPFGFHGPLKTDMESIGIDYTQYGHEQ